MMCKGRAAIDTQYLVFIGCFSSGSKDRGQMSVSSWGDHAPRELTNRWWLGRKKGIRNYEVSRITLSRTWRFFTANRSVRPREIIYLKRDKACIDERYNLTENAERQKSRVILSVALLCKCPGTDGRIFTWSGRV